VDEGENFAYGPTLCKGKTLLGVVNKLFVFSTADPKQNMIEKN
jgi:hypothetical protein